VLNLSNEESDALAERLQTEQIAWNGGRIVTFEGTARVSDSGSLAHEDTAYLEKYRDGIAGLGVTPEQLGAEFSTAILITPARVRVY
jgi:hypothetical protein